MAMDSFSAALVSLVLRTTRGDWRGGTEPAVGTSHRVAAVTPRQSQCTDAPVRPGEERHDKSFVRVLHSVPDDCVELVSDEGLWPPPAGQ